MLAVLWHDFCSLGEEPPETLALEPSTLRDVLRVAVLLLRPILCLLLLTPIGWNMLWPLGN